ncbi:hypothetical protein JOD57_003689 [Geodermatophilus bullaregiensis]|uniref:DUF3618 domain-containing protein n=1 Tax=Geodermatophilus bullaregiensis TaxID=1564160 RepID=UPI001957B7BA|nr:DUF3618 domain-containing protein [Geodermatophilus bullaregiensis]MBM7807852.1 hypothetical protein [Geodermatophilus bullaregiensis]
MPRDPREIQLEIDAARESLAATLDHLAHRGSPTRLKAQGQAAVQRFLVSPAGKATVGGLGVLVTLVAVRKVRQRRAPKRRVATRRVQPRKVQRRRR